jgi:hypothetical protein
MEGVGEYRGLEQDSALFASVRHHDAHFFPALRSGQRTTFARQAANRWRLKERLWQHARGQLPHDTTLALMDRLPLPVCPFARARRCRRFPGAAAFGRQRHAGAPDLLGLARPRPAGVARGDWPILRRPGQHARTAGAPGVGRADERNADRRPPFLVAHDHRRVRRARRCPVRAVPQRHTGSAAARARTTQATPLPPRHGLRRTRRSLCRQAGLGPRLVASRQAVAAHGRDAYARHRAQLPPRQPAVAARSGGGLKQLAHRVS